MLGLFSLTFPNLYSHHLSDSAIVFECEDSPYGEGQIALLPMVDFMKVHKFNSWELAERLGLPQINDQLSYEERPVTYFPIEGAYAPAWADKEERVRYTAFRKALIGFLRTHTTYEVLENEDWCELVFPDC